MANRYANLEGSKKISEDWSNINVGFDRVQAEMDTKGTPADAQEKADAAQAAAIATAAEALAAHKARGADEHPTATGAAAGFMSAADKGKMNAATADPTASTLMQRDAEGRAKVTAPAAADDIARKAETDAVQGNLDSHAADADIHVTAADHTKLNGIQVGAEVNQNAFAKVNDVTASGKSDTLQITGGTGITITSDQAGKRVTVTATGDATPGPHASSHITGGADVIPDAVTDGDSGLMSGADARFVREDGETKTGAQEKADAAETAAKEYTDEQVGAVADRLNTPERAAITLQPGISVVSADQDAAFRLAGLQGRTMLNYEDQIGIFGVLNPYVIRWADETHEDIASMLALQTELHANPDTGADPDTVFERYGQYYKLAKWKRLVISGELDWVVAASSIGFKQLQMMSYLLPITGNQGYTTKYNGNLLPNFSGVPTSSDLSTISQNSGAYYITVANTDGGWGDDYTPTVDEIKAYFMGWKMYDGSIGTITDTSTYTRTDGLNKAWAYRNKDGVWVDGTGTLPTNRPNNASQTPSWSPYQFLYQLATPVVEPITSEGQLTFFNGDNQVEVGTGLVLRESVKPALSGGSYHINNTAVAGTSLKFKTNKILNVFKGSKLDSVWIKRSDNASGYGGGNAYAIESQYELSAAYSVTYLMLDKYPVANFDGTYAENEKALLLDAVKSIQENTTRISVLESKKAEKDSPVWITPTLLNGWVSLGIIGYRKRDSNVQIKAKLNGPNGQVAFILPAGYRPIENQVHAAHSYGSTGSVIAAIEVRTDGRIVITTTAPEEVNIYLTISVD